MNNIKPPNVVEQIIEVLSETEYSSEFDVNQLFDGSLTSVNGNRELSIIEKINAVYHQLNFLGYHRDKKMSKRGRFNASIADMTHASFACFCQVLLSFDSDFIYKTHASYEYLGIFTELYLLKK